MKEDRLATPEPHPRAIVPGRHWRIGWLLGIGASILMLGKIEPMPATASGKLKSGPARILSLRAAFRFRVRLIQFGTLSRGM